MPVERWCLWRFVSAFDWGFWIYDVHRFCFRRNIHPFVVVDFFCIPRAFVSYFKFCFWFVHSSSSFSFVTLQSSFLLSKKVIVAWLIFGLIRYFQVMESQNFYGRKDDHIGVGHIWGCFKLLVTSHLCIIRNKRCLFAKYKLNFTLGFG